MTVLGLFPRFSRNKWEYSGFSVIPRFWGALENRTLSYYKSVGIRHFFGNIEGGPLSGGAPPPYAREKVKIRLLRGRSDFDVSKNRQNPQKMKKTRSESAESDFDVAKNRGCHRTIRFGNIQIPKPINA